MFMSHTTVTLPPPFFLRSGEWICLFCVWAFNLEIYKHKFFLHLKRKKEKAGMKACKLKVVLLVQMNFQWIVLCFNSLAYFLSHSHSQLLLFLLGYCIVHNRHIWIYIILFKCELTSLRFKLLSFHFFREE
jgi:hypothetical protein